MYAFTAENPNHAWICAVDEVLAAGQKQDSRVSGTLEIHPAIIEILDPADRLVTAYGRPTNPAFAIAEVLWILGGRNDVGMMLHYNSKFDAYSDDGATFNAAYGFRLRYEFGHDQIEDVIQLLIEKPDSRQAVLNIWSPAHDRAHDDHPHVSVDRYHIGQTHSWQPRETKDRACNLMSHLMIRNGYLDWMQVMRSNDIIWGTPNNFMQWMHIQEYVAARLGVQVGKYYHIVDSLHMYDYHQQEAEAIEPFNLYKKLDITHAPMMPEEMEAASVAESRIRRGIVDQPLPTFNQGYWADTVEIFKSWAAYKQQDNSLALLKAVDCDDLVLGAAQLRYYWWWRWHNADDRFQSRLKSLAASQYGNEVADWITSGHN